MMKKSITIKLFKLPIFSVEIITNDDNNIVVNSKKNIINPSNNSQISLLNKTNNDLSNHTFKVKEDLNKNKKEFSEKKLIVNCPSCNGKTYQEDIDICSVCNKTICPDCSTVDESTNMKYCNKCWIKN